MKIEFKRQTAIRGNVEVIHIIVLVLLLKYNMSLVGYQTISLVVADT